ncbi:MAG: phage shock protein PspC [Chloroflexi bacterium]|nr:phage shock protein PspC [Chloroflexota bacterium]
MNRRLYRCRDDRRIAGVASGVAEFFDLDPTVVRVVWFVSIFFAGLTILLYIAMALIVPLEPMSDVSPAEAAGAGADPGAVAAAGHRHAPRQSGRLSLFFGYALVLVGIVALVDAVAPAWESSRYLWPAFIIGIGAFLVAGALRRERNGS